MPEGGLYLENQPADLNQSESLLHRFTIEEAEVARRSSQKRLKLGLGIIITLVLAATVFLGYEYLNKVAESQSSDMARMKSVDVDLDAERFATEYTTIGITSTDATSVSRTTSDANVVLVTSSKVEQLGLKEINKTTSAVADQDITVAPVTSIISSNFTIPSTQIVATAVGETAISIETLPTLTTTRITTVEPHEPFHISNARNKILAQHAMAIDSYRNISLQVHHLTSIAENDYERSKLIYLWLTHNIQYDTEKYMDRSLPDATVEDVFRTRRAVCSGYARLFESMAAVVNVSAIVVTGYGKGISYTKGSKISKPNHAWNAVTLYDSRTGLHTQILVDATWGAGYIFFKDGRYNYKPKPRDYYFDVNPYEFVLTHLPKKDQANLQMIDDPLDLREYEHMSPVSQYTISRVILVPKQLFEAVQAGHRINLPHIYEESKIKFISTWPLDVQQGMPYSIAFRYEGGHEFYATQNRQKLELDVDGAALVKIRPNQAGIFEFRIRFLASGQVDFWMKTNSASNAYQNIMRYNVL